MWRMEQPASRITVGRDAAEDVKVRAHNTLVWKTVDFEIDGGEHARFRVINRPGLGTYTMLSLLGTGPIYLSLERLYE